MHRLTCGWMAAAFCVAIAGCGDDSGDGNDAGSGAGAGGSAAGASAAGSGGGGAAGSDAGTGGSGAAGSGEAGSGAAGSGDAGSGGDGGSGGEAGSGDLPNMPDQTCLDRDPAKGNPACAPCACTPNALGGCLDELDVCMKNEDEMHNTLCGDIIACAQENGCNGDTCIAFCMDEIQAALAYEETDPNPLGAARAVGFCIAEACPEICP